jgi:O-antigen ligase
MNDFPFRESSAELITDNWFPLFLTIFITGFFWAPTTKLLNNIYYVFVLLPLVVLFLVRSDRIAKAKSFICAYGWLSIFVAAVLVSSLVNKIDIDSLGRQLMRVLYVIGFLVAIKVVVQSERGVRHFWLPFIMLAVALSCCYSIYLANAVSSPTGPRMLGYGITDNAVRLGAIYGFAGLAALISYLSGQSRSSYLYLVPCALALYVVVLSESRGPLLAVAISSAVALLAIRGRRSVFIAVLAAVVAVVGIVVLSGEVQQSRIFSLDGPRIEIWSIALDKITQAPWFGYGLQAAEGIDLVKWHFEHPHGGFITTLLLGGIISLLALFALIGSTALRGAKNPDLTPWRILLCFGLIYMVFDGSRLFYHPRELWLIFWLPMGFLLALTTPKIEF